MVLTREEKESLVLDLYNEGKSTREIAQIAHMYFRDIGAIIDKKEKEQESKEGHTRQGFLSTHAYKLFSEGKTTEEVAIALNLRQPQVTEFYTDHWKLKGLYMLNQIYGGFLFVCGIACLPSVLLLTKFVSIPMASFVTRPMLMLIAARV